MIQLHKCIHLYIGCDTDKGRFAGIRDGTLLIKSKDKLIEEFHPDCLGKDIFLYLRPLSSLSEDQSRQLIAEGISIGRPHGYTFPAKSFLYLLSLSVDLFGLINSGLAKNIPSTDGQL